MSRPFGWYRIRGRSRASLAVSLVVHVVAAVGLLNVAFRYELGTTGLIDSPDRATRERLRYVRVAPQLQGGGPATATGTSPAPIATRRLRAPERVPVGIPEPATGKAAAALPGPQDRPGGASRDPRATAAAGVQPAYTDPRLWPQPGPFVPVPKTAAERTDSAVKAAFGVFIDSVRTAEANKGREPGDWTFKDKDGNKWGWDQAGIRLGRVTIPQAVLALLPLNVQANPTFNDPVTARENAFRRNDLLFHADRAVSEDEFRRAVKRIRERKDRERAAARGDKANGDEPQPVATPSKAQK